MTLDSTPFSLLLECAALAEDTENDKQGDKRGDSRDQGRGEMLIHSALLISFQGNDLNEYIGKREKHRDACQHTP